MSSEYCKNHIYESVEKLKKAITLKKFNEIIPASYLPIVQILNYTLGSKKSYLW